MPSTVLTGTTDVGSSAIIGEFLTCPGRTYEFDWALQLVNQSDGDITINDIECIAPAVPSFVVQEFLPWVDPVDRTRPNTPEEGCNGMRMCPGCFSEVDEWIEEAEEKANLLYGLVGNEGGFPPTSPVYIHTFTGGTETWSPPGGLVLEPGEWVYVFSAAEITVNFSIEIEIPASEMAIAGVIPALAGAMEVVPSRTLEIAAVIPALVGDVNFLWGYAPPGVSVDFDGCPAGTDPGYVECEAGEG